MCHEMASVFAIFDTVGVANTRLTRLFDDNTEWSGIDHGLWLADTLESLRSLDGNVDEGTRTPIDTAWQSPWVGSSTEDIIAFLDSLPESHLSLDRKHFIVIDKTLETDGTVWCYRNKDWGNDEELEDYPAAQLGRRGLTRFALPASWAAGRLYPMLTMDWEECLVQGEEPHTMRYEDKDW